MEIHFIETRAASKRHGVTKKEEDKKGKHTGKLMERSLEGERWISGPTKIFHMQKFQSQLMREKTVGIDIYINSEKAYLKANVLSY